MANTIFYSWQSDTPTDCGTDLIEAALDLALRQLRTDITLDKAIRELDLDRDTKNTPGQPSIADTIFRKIDSAAVFIPDLTLVGKRLDEKKPSPNPNVLIEYGYAVKALTHERIVPVMNTAYGKPEGENIPFDMRHLRHPIQYYCQHDVSPDKRKSTCDELASKLKEGISAVLKARPSPPSAALFHQYLAVDRFRSGSQSIGETYDPLLTGRDSTTVKLGTGPAAWFKIAPIFDPGHTWKFTEIFNAAHQRIGPLIEPFGIRTLGYLRTSDGFGIYAINESAPEETHKLVFITVRGELLAIVSNAMRHWEHNGQPIIYPMTREFSACLKNYSTFLKSLGISPPFNWQVGMEDTRGRSMITEPTPGSQVLSAKCLVPTIFGSGNYLPNQDPVEVLRPFTEKLYDSCGLQPPPMKSSTSQ